MIVSSPCHLDIRIVRARFVGAVNTEYEGLMCHGFDVSGEIRVIERRKLTVRRPFVEQSSSRKD